MKNGFMFFFGLFFALTISWACLVLGLNGQLSTLSPHYDDLEGKSFPERASGLAARGLAVYQDLGCAACHTQQVRRADYGADQARGWGSRQSVARDYVYQVRPQLGASRIGPDLANYGARAEQAGKTQTDVLVDLYNGSNGMPAYSFLFDTRKIVGEASPKALHGVAPTGYELVPTERAETLAAYLLSLKQTYAFTETAPYVVPESTEGAHE